MNEPYSYLDRDGRPVGFDVDVMSAVAEKLSWKIAIVLTDRQAARDAARQGQADGLIGLRLDRQDASRTDWLLCGPTVRLDYDIVAGANDEDVTGLASLDGTRVAFMAGDPVESILDNNERVTRLSAPSVRLACAWVDVRRVTAFVCDRNAVNYCDKTYNLAGLKFVGATVYSVGDYGPAVPKSGDAKLAEQIKQALERLAADGTLGGIQRKWFDHELNALAWYERPRVRSTLQIVGVVAGLCLLGGLWTWRVRSGVHLRTRRLSGELEALRHHVAELEARAAGAVKKPAAAPAAPAPAPAAKQTLDLNEFVRRVGPAVRRVVGPDIQITQQLAEELPPVQANADELAAALENLCTNARDAVAQRHAADPQAPRHVTILTRLARPDDLPPARREAHAAFVALAVRDTGVGVAQEQVPKLFQAGYTTKPGAAGQGLKIVYTIVAQHGGWIDVESAPNRGATFRVFLPAADSQAAPANGVDIVQ